MILTHLKMLAEFTKVRIAAMATLTAAVGYALSPGMGNIGFGWMLAGVFLLACGAGALNQVQERAIDALMPRTRNRPLPTGRMTTMQGRVVAVGLILLGLVMLLPSTTVVMLGAATVMSYNGVYTWLKRVSRFAAIPGGVVGALPPVIGYAAGGGSVFDPAIVAVAVFFFVWQVPHYWILLLRFGDEYELAGLPTLTSVLSRRQLARLTWMWMIATGVVCMTLPVYIESHVGILVGLLGATFWVIRAATVMLRSGGDVLVFREINLYALMVMSLISINGLVG